MADIDIVCGRYGACCGRYGLWPISFVADMVVADIIVSSCWLLMSAATVTKTNTQRQYNLSVDLNKNDNSKWQNVESKMEKWAIQLWAYLVLHLKWWLIYSGGESTVGLCHFMIGQSI